MKLYENHTICNIQKYEYKSYNINYPIVSFVK